MLYWKSQYGEKWTLFKYVESVKHGVLHLCIHVAFYCNSSRHHPSSNLPNRWCHHYWGYVIFMKCFYFTVHASSMCWKGSLLIVILLSTSRKFEQQVFSEFHIRYPCPSYNTNERRPRMQFHAQFNDLHYRWTFKLYSLFSMKTLYIKKANNSLLDGNGELWKASYKQNAVTNACFRLWQKISKLDSLFVRWWTLIEKMLETSF